MYRGFEIEVTAGPTYVAVVHDPMDPDRRFEAAEADAAEEAALLACVFINGVCAAEAAGVTDAVALRLS